MPVTDAMLRNPPDGDWLMVRRNYQAWSHSPLTGDHARQRKDAQARLGVGDERGRGQRADADRPQRHHLSGQHRQHRAGARRAHRRADLGEQRRPGGDHGQARCATWRSTRTSCSSRRPTRGWWRSTRGPAAGLGRRHRRAEQGLHQHQRSDRDQRQGDPGAGRLRTFRPERCYISAYDAETGKQLWKFNTVADSGERGGDTWGNVREHVPQGRRDLDHRQLRSRSQPHLLGRGAGEAVGGGEPRT